MKTKNADSALWKRIAARLNPAHWLISRRSLTKSDFNNQSANSG
ncbi:hypothetical protein [Aquamicrobium defluvii]|nr:hypothetical protein [Aquamicrobium defluvii]